MEQSKTSRKRPRGDRHVQHIPIEREEKEEGIVSPWKLMMVNKGRWSSHIGSRAPVLGMEHKRDHHPAIAWDSEADLAGRLKAQTKLPSYFRRVALDHGAFKRRCANCA